MSIMKQKICVIIPAHWEAIMGGAQYQAKLLIEALLAQKRYEIYYLTSVLKPEFSPVGYQIIQIAERKGLRRYGYFFDANRLNKLLNDIKPDIIYQRVGCGWTGIAAQYALKHRCNMVWHIAHDRTLQPFEFKLTADVAFKWLEKQVLEFGIRHAPQIVAQTFWQQEQLEKRYRRKATVIPNFHPSATEVLDKSAPIKVVWVANLKPWKRPEVFVGLAQALRHLSHIEFIMVGKNMLNAGELDGIMAQIEQTPNLRYLGQQSQQQVNHLLSTSHVFVNTSRYEGFANTFIQAWMRKVAVVSLEVDPDQLLSQSNLGICCQGNVDLMRQNIVSLIQDSTQRTTLAERAYQYAMKNHSEDNIDRLVAMLNQSALPDVPYLGDSIGLK